MQIFEIRIYSNDSSNGVDVLIDSSGQNGFGGTTRRRYAYLVSNNDDETITYYGDDSKADKSISKYTSFSDKLEITLSQEIKKLWTGEKEYISIDVDKVLRNLDQVEN